MEKTEAAFRILNMFSNWSKNTYSEKQAEKIYFEIYEPIVNKLLPFMKKYDGNEDDDFVNTLRDCQTILVQNSALSNPVYIKRIDRILNSDANCKKCPLFSNQFRAKCQAKYEKKNKKFRKNVFEFLVQDLITEYNLLRKKLGLRKLTILQRVYLDQMAYKDYKSALTSLLVLLIILVIPATVILILKLVALYINIFTVPFNL